MTGSLPLPVLYRTDLPGAQPAAQPGARQRNHDERERIPPGTEFRPPVPRCDNARDTQDNTYDAEDQSVLHGPIGCEPRHDVTAYDAVDHAITDREQPQGRTHRLEP